MHEINIDSLSEEELVELNHKIVARLRFLHDMRSHTAMLDFRIGERVKFHPAGRPSLTGTITRYNKKTITVITDSGEHWNVALTLLSRIDSSPGAASRNQDHARSQPLRLQVSLPRSRRHRWPLSLKSRFSTASTAGVRLLPAR